MVIRIGLADSFDSVPRDKIAQCDVIFAPEHGVSDINWLASSNPETELMSQKIKTAIIQRKEKRVYCKYIDFKSILTQKNYNADVIFTTLDSKVDDYRYRATYLYYAWSQQKILCVVNLKATSYVFHCNGECMLARRDNWTTLKTDFSRMDSAIYNWKKITNSF